MKSKHRRIFLLFWIAFGIYLISLIVPYSGWTEFQEDGQIAKKEYSNGIDSVFPTFCLVPIVVLIILIHVKHTNFTRWTELIISILMVFPILPLLYLITTLSIFFECYASIGFYLNCIAFILILVAAILKFRVPTERNKQLTIVDVLDDFN